MDIENGVKLSVNKDIKHMYEPLL